MLRNLTCLLTVLGATAAFADNDELVEKVVVRNRLFNVDGHFEAGLNVGFSMLSRLTDHYNFTLSGAYNFLDTLAVEVRVGYAVSSHTGLADQISKDFFANGSITVANDLADLWEMTANGVAGLRWQPIYGKLGLMAELPVHFQLYVWAGGGVGYFKRTSIVVCNATGTQTNPDTNKPETVCTNYLTDSKVAPLVSLALGFRFFVTGKHAIKLEVRDYSFLDSYLVGVNRAAALNPGNPSGNGSQAPNPGISNLVQFDLGYAYIF